MVSEILTPNEVSKILKIGLSKTYELIRQKKIPSICIGRKILIPESTLEKWIMEAAGVKK